MLKIELNMISKKTEVVHFTHFHIFLNIPKKSLKRGTSSNLGTKSLKVRALRQTLQNSDEKQDCQYF